jgi:hypothetical protein
MGSVREGGIRLNEIRQYNPSRAYDLILTYGLLNETDVEADHFAFCVQPDYAALSHLVCF